MVKRALVLVVSGALLLWAAAGFAISSSQPAPTRTSSTAPTVGDFVVDYATTMRLVSSGATQEQALAALRAAGVLGAQRIDLTAPLTERDVVLLSGAMNLGLTTRHPDRVFTQEQSDLFFDVFGRALREGRAGKLNTGLLGGAAGTGSGGLLDGDDDDDDDGSMPEEKPGTDPRDNPGRKKGISTNFPFP